MLFRPPFDTRSLFRLGMAAILAANLLHWFTRGAAAPWADVADGTMGLLMGIAIPSLLLSLRSRKLGCAKDAR
jgi:hypothetical protein